MTDEGGVRPDGTAETVTATGMSHGVVSHCHGHVSRCGQSLPDMSHGAVSHCHRHVSRCGHCHRHVSRCGQSMPQTCLTVWSLPQTCLTVWSVSHCHRHVSRCSGHCHRHVSRCGQSLQSQLVCRLVSPASTALAAIDRLALFSRVTSFCPPTASHRHSRFVPP